VKTKTYSHLQNLVDDLEEFQEFCQNCKPYYLHTRALLSAVLSIMEGNEEVIVQAYLALKTCGNIT
jgi:hypothetical protein